MDRIWLIVRAIALIWVTTLELAWAAVTEGTEVVRSKHEQGEERVNDSHCNDILFFGILGGFGAKDETSSGEYERVELLNYTSSIHQYLVAPR